MAVVIGVTGGIGSGKSTVSRLLSEKLSAPILDADKIAKEAMKSPEIVNKIKDFFGRCLFDNNNILNSDQLANIVFSSEEKLLQLNAIVHPYVMDQIITMVAELSTNNKYIILDVPLPNNSFINLCNKIIVVTASEEVRITRIMQRSGLSRENVIKRIEKQMSQDQYLKLADIIIENSFTQDELKLKIGTLAF